VQVTNAGDPLEGGHDGLLLRQAVYHDNETCAAPDFLTRCCENILVVLLELQPLDTTFSEKPVPWAISESTMATAKELADVAAVSSLPSCPAQVVPCSMVTLAAKPFTTLWKLPGPATVDMDVEGGYVMSPDRGTCAWQSWFFNAQVGEHILGLLVSADHQQCGPEGNFQAGTACLAEVAAC
jgi:hypothetical protein